MSDEPLEIDVGDQPQVQSRAKDHRLLEQEEGEALSTLLASGPGRRFIYKILESCHVYATSFSESVPAMAFAEGERNVGLRLIAAIQQHCPARYLEMIQEHERSSRSDEPRQSRNAGVRPADAPFGNPAFVADAGKWQS